MRLGLSDFVGETAAIEIGASGTPFDSSNWRESKKSGILPFG
jgi:hypothetical protein